MMHQAIGYLESRPLRTKLLLLFAGLFTLLCLIISIVIYISSAHNSQTQIRYSASQSFQQAQTFVENKVQSALYASDLIVSNREVQQLMEAGGEKSLMDAGNEFRAMQKIWNLLLTMQTQDVFNACLFVYDGFTYTQQGVNFRPLSEVTGDPRYQRLLASVGQPIWYPPMYIQIEKNLERVICLMRVVRAQEDYGKVVGVGRIGVLAQSIDEILQNANITRTSITYLVNRDGALISTSDTARALDYAAVPVQQQDWDTVTLEGISYLIKSAPIAQTDWQMVSLLPTQEFRELGQQFLPTLIAWLLPLLLVAIVLIWVISRSVTRRVSLLATQMTHVVSSGDLSVRVQEGAQDEIGRLCGTFNYMVENLSDMAQARYEQGKAIKQAELKALQAQINPHFLYNTLDLMNWMALGHDAPDLAELTRTMARFYRLSLGRGKDFVHLADELEHAATYIKIQSSRFAGKLSLHIDVPAELRELEVLKLILQPIVENSVLHGLDSAQGVDHIHIVILARMEGSDLLITVQDDGVGMTPEAAENVLHAPPERQQGYGVQNIDMRLRLCYGEGYGLSITSEPCQGTRVTLRMPAQRMRKA